MRYKMPYNKRVKVAPCSRWDCQKAAAPYPYRLDTSVENELGRREII